MESEFDWHTTGKVNMAHEAIEWHYRTNRKDKIAMYYISPDREE